MSPGRHQAINWTNAGILSIEPLGTNFSEISNEILACIFIQENVLNMSSGKWRPYYLGLDMYVFDCISNQVPEKCVILHTFNDMVLNAVQWIFNSSVHFRQNTDPAFYNGIKLINWQSLSYQQYCPCSNILWNVRHLRRHKIS